VIPGYFDPGYAHPWPRVRVGVLLTDITQDWIVVEFVLDTGASATCLHPSDALGVSGIDLTMLTDAARWSVTSTFRGIGGGVSYFTTPAQYGFLHDDGRLYIVDGTINIAQWTLTNQSLPSLLGWDVLANFSLYANSATGRLELTPHSTP
jgi:hypothetical protein